MAFEALGELEQLVLYESVRNDPRLIFGLFTFVPSPGKAGR